jgi:hypothetical protein
LREIWRLCLPGQVRFRLPLLRRSQRPVALVLALVLVRATLAAPARQPVVGVVAP